MGMALLIYKEKGENYFLPVIERTWLSPKVQITNHEVRLKVSSEIVP